MDLIPDTHEDLLERPVFAHMATLRPEGMIQNNPMWFVWDGTRVRMTTSTARQKFRNLEADPRVTLSVNDPDRPYRYPELRGRLVGVEPDTEGEFFGSLTERYGLDLDGPPAVQGGAARRTRPVVVPVTRQRPPFGEPSVAASC